MGAPLTTYKKLCTEFYDLEHQNRGAQTLAFYRKKAHAANGCILEPMCGSGRFLIPLLQDGLDAAGFDASPTMLAAFTKKYAVCSTQQAPVWHQFVQNFSRNKNYTLIFIPYGSWGLITNPEEAKVGLAALYNHLAPGGTLIIEIETIASVPQPCGIWRRRTHTRADGSRLTLHALTAYDEKTQLFESFCQYEVTVDGCVQETEEEDFKQYLYAHDEFDGLLRAVGCTCFKKYPAYDPAQSVDGQTATIIYECLAPRAPAPKTL